MQKTLSILNDGVKMPFIGFGTYKMTSEQVMEAIPMAISTGYRLFDTAQVYKNEAAVGDALRKALEQGSVKNRSDIFVTTKLSTHNQGYEKAREAIQKSFQDLNLDYIDLFLIHWPGAAGLAPNDPENERLRLGSWRALVEAKEAGLIRSIGVSNFQARHLQNLDPKPSVNQIELHPAYVDEETVAKCREMGIFIQAYSSLGRGRLLKPEFVDDHPIFGQISKRTGASMSQILLKWALQLDFGVIPKSTHKDRIIENWDLCSFTLESSEMQAITEIHKTASAEKVCWDPSVVS